MRERIAKTVLSILAIGAIAVVAIAMPNVMQVLRPLVLKKRGGVNKRALGRVVKQLRERRLIEFVSRKGKVVLQITESGKKHFREFEFEALVLKVPERWDRQWTVILYDIPERYKVARNALHHKLRELGCFQYHKSVFVHPADCADEIDFIAELFQIKRFVLHFRAASLGAGEYRAVRHFNLV